MAQESIRSPVPLLVGKACSPRRSACLAALLLATCVGSARGAGLDLAFTFTDPSGDGGEWGDLVQVDVYYSSETGDFEVIMTADAAAPFVGRFGVPLRALRR